MALSPAQSSGREGARIALGPGAVVCLVCGKKLVGRQKRYCGPAHKNTAKLMRRRGQADQLGTGFEVNPDSAARGSFSGSQLEDIVAKSQAGQTHLEIASGYGVHPSTITRVLAFVSAEHKKTAAAADWTPPPRDFPENVWELSLADLPAMVEDFKWWRATFRRTPRGAPFFMPEFMVRWITAAIKTLITGGRQVILSPVRHGKTELMIDFSAWLICRFPNIRIIWVAGTEKIATKSTRLIMRLLAGSKVLAETFAGPNRSFVPGATAGVSWSATDFTVATRTQTDIKGSTMVALGRGGTLSSLDADIIIGDDLEDFKATVQPGARENTRDWWTSDFESRKEEHTGLFVIGSRSHIDDLNGHLLESDEYESIVETAHAPWCEIDPDDPDLYDTHQECMLFPELRSYRWLMSQKRAAAAGGGLSRFNMVYLNNAAGKGMTIFVASEIAACQDADYVIGQIPRPIRPPGTPADEVGGIGLIGGLDPSGKGYQAAFLWAYQVAPVLHLWMVDIENQEGGGISKARETMANWHELYHLSHWVVEENLYQGGIISDEGIIELQQRLGIVVESHRTDVNKWDPYLGVSTLREPFQNRQITLPYGDPVSQAKTDLYKKQLVTFSDAPRNRNRSGDKNDVVMASWFPMGVIRFMAMEYAAESGVEYTQSYRFYRRNTWSKAPWARRKAS